VYSEGLSEHTRTCLSRGNRGNSSASCYWPLGRGSELKSRHSGAELVQLVVLVVVVLRLQTMHYRAQLALVLLLLALPMLHSVCGAGRESVGGANCSACAPGKFTTGDNARCTAWRSPCPVEQHVQTAGTAARDAVCAPCAEGYFKLEPSPRLDAADACTKDNTAFLVCYLLLIALLALHMAWSCFNVRRKLKLEELCESIAPSLRPGGMDGTGGAGFSDRKLQPQALGTPEAGGPNTGADSPSSPALGRANSSGADSPGSGRRRSLASAGRQASKINDAELQELSTPRPAAAAEESPEPRPAASPPARGPLGHTQSTRVVRLRQLTSTSMQEGDSSSEEIVQQSSALSRTGSAAEKIAMSGRRR